MLSTKACLKLLIMPEGTPHSLPQQHGAGPAVHLDFAVQGCHVGLTSLHLPAKRFARLPSFVCTILTRLHSISPALPLHDQMPDQMPSNLVVTTLQARPGQTM